MTKLRIAFDCSGTLLHSEKSRKLFLWLQSLGHEMIIWSNSYVYAKDAAQLMRVGPEVQVTTKSYWSRDPEDRAEFVDVAVDDDGWLDREERRPLLACWSLLDVADIPETDDPLFYTRMEQWLSNRTTFKD